ncbi:MAG: hypothetical protein FRX48_01137 [Lasallia pustulata]|uniref:Uncharacterized protein n=1 Tax=Lasallia pustulata TaxID=136370 RepID=A0A5M8PZM4_9LECA|nr:MAG: hypothetical protein FRX48_01137 [Lasallia pustulata]
MGSGLPSRRAELAGITWCNGETARNIYLHYNSVAVITGYHKSQWRIGTWPTVHFLPPAVGELLVRYLIYVPAFVRFLVNCTQQVTLPNALFSEADSTWIAVKCSHKLNQTIQRINNTMPEGLTYRDMWRRIAKGVPNTQNFKLKLFPLHGRTTAKDPALRKLTGLAKKKAKDNTSLDAFPSNMKSYPGFDALPDNIQTGIINLDGSDIQYHGKSLGIPLGQGFWIQIHCVLHGHVLLIRTEELNAYQASWRDNPHAAPHIQIALINQDSTLPSIILCDRNKLATATFLHCSETSDFPPLLLWYDPQLGPCPFKEPAA